MKKFACLFGAIMMACAACYAEVILKPEWSDFAPPEYVNTKDSKLIEARGYWYKRRVQFEESLSRCAGYTGEDLKSCYGQIRSIELSKNEQRQKYINDYNERLEKQREANDRYYNTQRTYNAINKLIDKI